MFIVKIRFGETAIVGLATVFILLICPGTARGELSHKIGVAAGFDARLNPEIGGHGFGLVAYDLDGLPAESHFGFSYNTDTVRLNFDRIRFANGVLEAGAHVAYEFVFAGLLTDYFLNGMLEEDRSFNAAYLELGAHIKANIPGGNYLEIALNGRRWWFDASTATNPSLELPEDMWVFEPRLRYTFWRVRDDPSLQESHRLFPRVRGAAIGVELGVDVRNEDGARPWGARDGEVFEPVDPRNEGAQTILIFRQWARGGLQLSDRFRIQIAEFAGAGKHEDDLTRVRIGGMNPYVVPLAGAPWAAVLSDFFIALELSLHLRVWREIEIGVLGHGVALEDPSRIGEREFGLLGGVGGFVDIRFGAFQIDLRAGWTPSLSVPTNNHWSFYFGFGWGWHSR